MKKIAIVGILLGLSGLAHQAFAHVVVKPSQVGVAAFQTFTVGVPVEKNNPTIGLRLMLPSGLKYVTPNVKPGWTIAVKKDAGDQPTEIDWTGGSIPVGQRDEFIFSAQVPATPTDLAWKAYQRYSDGVVVGWDQDPNASSTKNEMGTPFSVTHVVNDLTAAPAASEQNQSSDWIALTLSIVAVIISVVALYKTRSV